MMGSGVSLGAGLVMLGEMNVADRKVAHAQMEAVSGRGVEISETMKVHQKYVFAARSQVHGLRSRIIAHMQTEDELIAALKAENANHPLASREAVDAAIQEKLVRNLVDPEVIKRTYPDGKLPDGAVIPPDGWHQIA